MSNTSFSAKEQKKRYELLNERPAWIVFKTALPLLLFSFLKVAFQFFDVLTISKIDQNMVSVVLFVSDIQSILDCVFMAMAIGVAIRISQSFGAGDFSSIRRDLSTIFFTFVFISLLLVLFCIPFAEEILRFFGIPEEMLEIGSTYFSISIFSAVFVAVNVLYFASEKARGKTKIVSVCNIVLLVTKLFFNFVIMYLIDRGVLNKEHAVILLPLSICVSQFLIMIFALRGFFAKESPFRVSFRSVSFNKKFILSYLKLTLPVILIKSMTPLAKVICNSQYAVFGSLGLTAFACSNKICSIATSPLDALQDAETAVIAANIGNHRYERVRKTVSDSLWLFLVISTVLFLVVSLSSETLMNYFASNDVELLGNIRTLYRIQRLDFLFMAFDSVFTAYLFATKKTKLKTISSFLQKFAIRIPLLYFLINRFGFGIEAIALSILISNISASLFTTVSYLFISRYYEGKLKANDQAETRLIDAVRTLGRLDALDSDRAGSSGALVPIDLIEMMKENFAVNIETDKLVEEYQYALVEARIDELEKQELM